jgi:bifunctional DNA-binding transcriptional regulator/antitoxin component of YhaV-PrlF toxin-antitoxin module
MLQNRVSVRGQTVIPREIRRALGITEKTVLRWTIQDGAIVVYPIPDDPVEASIGILKGALTVDDLLEERRRERAREATKEAEE